jgi:hypothetical protein
VRGQGPSPRPLAVGVATDGPWLWRWQAAVATSLAEANSLELVRWFHLGAKRPRRLRAGGQAVDIVGLPVGLPSATKLPAQPEGPALDVVLDLTRGGRLVDWARIARDSWRFVYGRDQVRDAVRVALCDLTESRGATRVALVDARDRVLRAGLLRTTSSSLSAHLDAMLLEPASWPANVASLRIDGESAGPSDPDWGERDAAGPREGLEDATCGQPGGASLALLGLRAAAHRVAALREPLIRHDNWNIGLVDRPVEAVTESGLGPVTWLPSRRGRYAADPFGLEERGALHVFFEDYDQVMATGIISHVEVRADGDCSPPEPILDPGCHASYPYLLRAEDAVWMVPETADAREVRLYRAVDFPTRWELETVLLKDVQVSDPTIVERDGRWWLFGTTRGRGVDDALRIWYAPRLTGPWSLHAIDPVKVDARSSRPAGTPFIMEGKLHRPAQDCSERYGGQVVVNRVELLNERQYAERPIRQVRPAAGSRYAGGLHTLNGVGRRTLIDGNAVGFVPEALVGQIRRRLDGGRPRHG